MKSMSLRYIGPSVENGSIDAEDLICGLDGLVRISSVILNEHPTLHKNQISLRVNKFNKGSFETMLSFLESHPNLLNSATAIVAASIPALVYYLVHKRKSKKINDKEIERIIDNILSDPRKLKKIRKGFNNIAMPLSDSGLSSVEFGLTKKPEEIMNQENKNYFLDASLNEEEIHRSIELTGELRSLDKKTLNGKFISGNNTYSVSLIMKEPEDFFHFFNKESITISGIASQPKGSDEINKIEIEKIY